MLTACGGPEADAPAPSGAAPSGPSAVVSEEPSHGLESEPPAETERTESQTPEIQEPETRPPESEPPAVTEDGWYSSKEEVALYIHLYGHLPGNYVTKRQAEDKGWSGGSVERYTGEGTAIGGSRFGNYEGLLPEAAGRSYQECDIDTVGASSRGTKRIVYSNDGLIYYTGDHYESFELLYGEP
ncbi:MAG: ribonuclease [Oscillospiraceae bacterium]|nr:ribonuclease [Oscillospiraceae bacterium]